MSRRPADRPFELVIFDCDGVLIDSERLGVRLEVALLARLGWALTEGEVFRRFGGRTDREMRAEIEAHLGREIGPDWAAHVRETRRVFAASLGPVDGVAVALDAVAAAGIRSCVASSGDLAKIRRNLGLTGLLERFDGRIFSAADVAHGKPAPDLFLHAAAVMGVPPGRCAVVEDSPHGVAAARAAGMAAFGYAGGVTPAASLAGHGTTVFADMRELPRLLGLASLEPAGA